MTCTLHHGDCLEVLATLPDCSVDAIVTDPPAGIAFMGKDWDKDKGGKAEWIDWMFEVALQCRRVIKPGGHALVWAIPRTSHWTGDAWEEAGWQVRDKIYHVFGSGFPKSMDVSKAIDKMDAGEEQERRRFRFTAWVRSTGVTARQIDDATSTSMGSHYTTHPTQPAIMTREHLERCRHLLGEVPEWAEREADIRSVESKNFAERQVIGRKEMTDTTKARAGFSGSTHSPDYDGSKRLVNLTAPATPEAKQWAGWGTALKPAAEEWWLFRRPLEGTVAANVLKHGTGAINVDGCRVGADLIKGSRGEGGKHGRYGLIGAMDYEHTGRFPANFTHDGSDEVTALLGDAARFFYSPKASKADRDEGCEGMEAKFSPTMNNGIGGKEHDPDTATPKRNSHPTVKSQDLMTYLCRLITPPGGTILDPFTGSGSTGKAAILEDFKFIGIEREAEYIEIARARIDAAIKFRSEFLF